MVGDAARQDEAAPSYPVYALAGGILVLNPSDNARHDAARLVLVQELRARQLTEDLGWSPSDPNYGGWGYSWRPPRKPRPGEDVDPLLSANLSSTTFAVGAMRLAGVEFDDPAILRAETFVERCQNFSDDPDLADPAYDDGGFFFSPSAADENKAGRAGADGHGRVRFRSYGSMTSDGVRALLQIGLGLRHPRVMAASRWLERNYEATRNPGDFPRVDEVRRESAYFYWMWTSAHALRALEKRTLETASGTVTWAEAHAEELLSRQNEDGSWSNPYTEMREDDPLVATSFAAAALGVARIAITGEFNSHRR